tara:strand:- start:94 stop:318 length:225 start_codon:yes stop_codon:yes gene_type:complete
MFASGLLFNNVAFGLSVVLRACYSFSFLSRFSLLGKKLEKAVAQANIAEKQSKVLWHLCAFSLMIAWFGIFWKF